MSTAGGAHGVCVVAIALLAAGAAVGQGTRGRGAAVSCPNSQLGAADLHCTPLIAVPDLPGASGILQVLAVRSPFGLSIAADGRPRQRLVATVAGLPDPHTLGAATVYVAWAYTLNLDSAARLGVVTNGRVELGELDYVQFRILVSAERSAHVTERSGRLVLRGTSPSARLMAHRDFVAPAAPGLPPDTARSNQMLASDGMPHVHAGPDPTLQWAMPPTPQSPLTPAMQGAMSGASGMGGLVPDVAPFRAGAESDTTRLPLARTSIVMHMRDGDTLALDAGLVRRTIYGRGMTTYAYNGQAPGPLIEVDQGATIVVRFTNSIDLPSTVHWHGIRLDNRSDGVPGVTQPALSPGAAVTYHVHFPDAGIYWYHAHHREDIQQDLGLYGSIRVRSPKVRYFGPANREEVLMLDDILVSGGAPMPYGAESPTHALMGRFGNVFLVNGVTGYRLAVARGEVVRFLFTNAASARPFNLSFGGGRMKVVASDAGKFDHEEWVASVAIGPAERYVVDVEFADPGTFALVNRVQALDHMSGTFTAETDTLGTVIVSADPSRPRYRRSFSLLRHNADVRAELARVRPFLARAVDHTIELALHTRALPIPVSSMLWGVNTAVDWNDGMPMMNWITTGRNVTWALRDVATGAENMDIAWRFREGQIVKLRFVNNPSAAHAMDHPIHLHGQRFLVLTRDGVPNDNLVWKDTAIIPAGETVDLLVEMSNPGQWMMHCHIAEHLSAGMMSTFTVTPAPRASPPRMGTGPQRPAGGAGSSRRVLRSNSGD